MESRRKDLEATQLRAPDQGVPVKVDVSEGGGTRSSDPERRSTTMKRGSARTSQAGLSCSRGLSGAWSPDEGWLLDEVKVVAGQPGVSRETGLDRKPVIGNEDPSVGQEPDPGRSGVNPLASEAQAGWTSWREVNGEATRTAVEAITVDPLETARRLLGGSQSKESSLAGAGTVVPEPPAPSEMVVVGQAVRPGSLIAGPVEREQVRGLANSMGGTAEDLEDSAAFDRQRFVGSREGSEMAGNGVGHPELDGRRADVRGVGNGVTKTSRKGDISLAFDGVSRETSPEAPDSISVTRAGVGVRDVAVGSSEGGLAGAVKAGTAARSELAVSSPDVVRPPNDDKVGLQPSLSVDHATKESGSGQTAARSYESASDRSSAMSEVSDATTWPPAQPGQDGYSKRDSARTHLRDRPAGRRVRGPGARAATRHRRPDLGRPANRARGRHDAGRGPGGVPARGVHRRISMG